MSWAEALGSEKNPSRPRQVRQSPSAASGENSEPQVGHFFSTLIIDDFGPLLIKKQTPVAITKYFDDHGQWFNTANKCRISSSNSVGQVTVCDISARTNSR